MGPKLETCPSCRSNETFFPIYSTARYFIKSESIYVPFYRQQEIINFLACYISNILLFFERKTCDKIINHRIIVLTKTNNFNTLLNKTCPIFDTLCPNLPFFFRFLKIVEIFTNCIAATINNPKAWKNSSM